MHVVEGISDRVVALDHGVKIAEGSFDAVATNREGGRGVPRPADGGDRSERCSSSTTSTPTTGRSTSCRAVARSGRRRARLPARRQRLGQVDDAEDDPRHRAAAQRHACAFDGEDVTTRPTSYRIGARHGDRPGEPAAVRADDRAREPRDGRVPARRRREGGLRARLRALPAALRAARAARRARSRAASSRWSRWAAR